MTLATARRGGALLRTTYVGLDAAVRTWLDHQPGYLPPVQLGEVIRAAGIGEVVDRRATLSLWATW